MGQGKVDAAAKAFKESLAITEKVGASMLDVTTMMCLEELFLHAWRAPMLMFDQGCPLYCGSHDAGSLSRHMCGTILDHSPTCCVHRTACSCWARTTRWWPTA